MENLWREENGVFDVMAGARITYTIAEAIELSIDEHRAITFEFNGVKVNVLFDSDPELIYRDWQRALNGYIDKNVGPYPNAILNDKEKANDDRIEARNICKRQRQQAKYEAMATIERNKVEIKLREANPMEVSDENIWHVFVEKNKDDPYGNAVVTYAERWARLMQLEMSSGKTLEEVASTTHSEADLEGITGFMYGVAVSILAQCWKHGDQLRRWHNLHTQFGNEGEKANEEGGVLNPALWSISPK